MMLMTCHSKLMVNRGYNMVNNMVNNIVNNMVNDVDDLP